MMDSHSDIVKCLRTKSVSDLTEFEFNSPSFLSAMGPSRDGILIPSDFGIDQEDIRKSKRGGARVNYQVK